MLMYHFRTLPANCNYETDDENSFLNDSNFAIFNIQTFLSLEDLIIWVQKILVYNIMNKASLFDGNDKYC